MNLSFKYLVLIAATLIFGFSGCSNNDDLTGGTENVEETGKPAIVKISIAEPLSMKMSTRAADPNASALETNISSLDVYIYNNTTGVLVKHAHLFLADLTLESDGTYSATVSTTVGAKDFFVGINLPTAITNTIANTGAKNGVSQIQEVTVTGLTSPTNGFIMSSTDWVTKVLTENPSDNNVRVHVSRWVAKVAAVDNIVASGNSYEVLGGTFSNLEFTVYNNNKYIFPLQQVNPSQYIIDPNWNLPYANDGSGGYSLDFSPFSYDYISINDATTANNALSAKYTPENTTNKSPLTWDVVTFGSVRSQFIPNTIKVTNDDGATFTDEPNPAVSPETFYSFIILGTGERFFFQDEETAEAYSTYLASTGLSVGSTSEFTNGWVYYALVLNPGATNNGVRDVSRGDIARNAFYKTTITKITGLGYPTPVPPDPEVPGENVNVEIIVEIIDWELIEDSYELVP